MRRALVTGCSKGLGFATALALGAADGWDVVATMRDVDHGTGALRGAAAQLGVELAIAQLDVTDDRSVASAFDAAGPVDLLVNNAAVSMIGSVEETPIELWQHMLDSNFLGSVRCMRAVMPAMRERGSGVIINVSSVAVPAALAGTGAYAASKAALEHASAVAAIEGRPHGIHVIVVQAGAIASGMQPIAVLPSGESPYWSSMRNTFHYLRSNAPAATPPRSIADTIVHIASGASIPFRVATGQAAADTIALRHRHDDDSWHDFAADARFEHTYTPPGSDA